MTKMYSFSESGFIWENWALTGSGHVDFKSRRANFEALGQVAAVFPFYTHPRRRFLITTGGRAHIFRLTQMADDRFAFERNLHNLKRGSP